MRLFEKAFRSGIKTSHRHFDATVFKRVVNRPLQMSELLTHVTEIRQTYVPGFVTKYSENFEFVLGCHCLGHRHVDRLAVGCRNLTSEFD